jgi:hypothetical protein
MTKLTVLPAVLIAAAMIAGPAMARESSVASRHVTTDAYASTTPTSRYNDGRGCVRAPDVGAFASDPYVVPPCEPMTGF